MTALINFLLVIMNPGTPYFEGRDICSNITTVDEAIGCSTVNGRRVFNDAKFSE